VDYIFRWLAAKFLPPDEQEQTGVHVATPAPSDSAVPQQGVLPLDDFKSMYRLDDAPSCANCGSIMVRNGSCYKCINCGETSGCS